MRVNALLLATVAALVGASLPTSAAMGPPRCDFNFGKCQRGECAFNFGYCNGGNCTVNLGYCGHDCRSTVNAGACGRYNGAAAGASPARPGCPDVPAASMRHTLVGGGSLLTFAYAGAGLFRVHVFAGDPCLTPAVAACPEAGPWQTVGTVRVCELPAGLSPGNIVVVEAFGGAGAYAFDVD